MLFLSLERHLLVKNNVNNSLNVINVLNFCRKLSTNSKSQKLIPFESMVKTEKSSAKKYLILEDKCNILSKLNVENVSKLIDFKVNNLWKWSFGSHNCALIQLNTEIDVNSIGNRFGIDSNSFPINTRMITINSLPKKFKEIIYNNHNESNENSIQVLNRNIKEDSLNANVLKSLFKTNEELLNFLLYSEQWTELALKLRFFIVIQLEELLCNGAFNQFRISPFGSSLAGIGNSGSDLDLVLITEAFTSTKSLKFSCRELLLERKETQKSLELIADLVNHFVPNFSHVVRILRARVPIIKFNFDLAPIDIDLSIELTHNCGHHGVIMASYINHCHQLHSCFRDLLLFIRIWAKQHGLVKSQAGVWFTNFQLTALVIYFLQIKKIVPPIAVITKKTSLNYELLSEEIDFIELLREFFNFLISIEYNTKGISILNAKIVSKPDYSALYIENPIDPQLNICKNVIASEVEKLIIASHLSLDVMNCEDFLLADILDNSIPLKKVSRLKAVKVNDLFTN